MFGLMRDGFAVTEFDAAPRRRASITALPTAAPVASIRAAGWVWSQVYAL
jgi:hypothetical protein